jgi:branched-chain amino acid transport system ATP-binding protein
MIEVHDLHKHFGGFRAVDGASLTIRQGSITGLIGPNGAGKTTLFNVIAGGLAPTSGRVTMAGESITGLRPHELFHKGLLRTFQIAHEFSSMTVRENLMMVPLTSWAKVSGTPGSRAGTYAKRRQCSPEGSRGPRFPHDLTLAEEKAGNLSGGQKKLLELGRTMMVDARIVFLDEWARREPDALNTIADADRAALNKERGYTFCVIEHDMDFIGRLCDPVIVMAQGKVLARVRPPRSCRTRR